MIKGKSALELQLDSGLMEQCCFVIEQTLDPVYRLSRNSVRNEIGPLEIRVVKNGTFDELMDYFLSLGTSMVQYKTPRCVKSEKAIELLNSWSPKIERKSGGQA